MEIFICNITAEYKKKTLNPYALPNLLEKFIKIIISNAISFYLVYNTLNKKQTKNKNFNQILFIRRVLNLDFAEKNKKDPEVTEITQG